MRFSRMDTLRTSPHAQIFIRAFPSKQWRKRYTHRSKLCEAGSESSGMMECILNCHWKGKKRSVQWYVMSLMRCAAANPHKLKCSQRGRENEMPNILAAINSADGVNYGGIVYVVRVPFVCSISPACPKMHVPTACTNPDVEMKTILCAL